jgi:hypothetical protein
MTARATFKKADACRAIESVQACGLPVARVEFNDNGIVVIVGEPEKRSVTNRRTLADKLYGPEAQVG